MYAGVKSHHHIPAAACYGAAQAALAAYDRLPSRIKDNPKAVTRVDTDDVGNIGFTLYDTQVVTWCPDNSVLVDNFGTVTTSSFAARFLPGDIHLHHPVARRGECGGDRGIRYRTDDGARLCHGAVVRFIEDTHGNWVPDETTCDPIDLPVLDREQARNAVAGLNLAEFANYLRMVPFMIDIEHDDFDLDLCCAALRGRDWRRATETLPPIKPGSGFGLEQRVAAAALPVRTYHGQYITMGSLDKLKLALWEDAGAFATERHMTIASKTYDSAMRRVRELEALGCDGHHWGMV